MRDQLIKALLAHAQGDIAKHKANIEVYLANPVGIGEHSNIIEAIEGELDMIAKYQDQIDIIKDIHQKAKTLSGTKDFLQNNRGIKISTSTIKKIVNNTY